MNDSILISLPLPVAVYAALVGIASADADVSIESLAQFAIRDFVETYTGCRLNEVPKADAGFRKCRLKAI